MRVFHAILSSLVTRCCGTIETANICEGVVQRENTHRYGKLKSFRNWGQPEFDGQKQADSDHPENSTQKNSEPEIFFTYDSNFRPVEQ